MICGSLPYSLNHKSESGCKYGEKCDFLQTEAGGSTKVKKSGGKGSVAWLKETIQLGCVSQDSPQRKSMLRERKIGIKLHSPIFQNRDASRKNSGEDGSIAGNHSKMRTSGASSVGSKI